MAGVTSAEERAARTLRRNAQADVVMLLLSAGTIALSALIEPSDSQLTLWGWQLPPLCLWKNLTGMDCLGCGLTRSFTYMGHLRLLDAWQMHKAGPLLWLVVLAQVPWRLALLWRFRRDLRG